MPTTLLDTKQRRRHQRGLERIFYGSRDGLVAIPLLRGAAGSYPDNPSRRMAIDDDGTLMVHTPTDFSVVPIEFSGPNKATLNDESDSQILNLVAPSTKYLYCIFPELREFDGFFGKVLGQANRVGQVSTSGDTTSFYDGTWTQRSADHPDNTTLGVFARYRDDIESFAVSNVRGVRVVYVRNTGGSLLHVAGFHVYGEISASETPDRLLWFDQPSALEFDLPIDYGDIPRGSAEDRVTFLKNNSSSLTASSVQVTAEDLYLGSGSWYTFDEGSGFSATLALASSIANGANSPNITIRRITPDAEDTGKHVGRAFAAVGSWA